MPTELGPVGITLKEKTTEFHSQTQLKATEQSNLTEKKIIKKQVLIISFFILAFNFTFITSVLQRQCFKQILLYLF